MTTVSDALFTKTQQRVLALLYGNPDKSFYTNAIVRWAGMGRGTIQRELDRLSAAELISVFSEGNQRHYQANKNSTIFNELTGIVKKTFGTVAIIQETIAPINQEIVLAFIYGSIAKGEETSESDIDLLVISDTLTLAELMELLLNAEEQLSRVISPAIYTTKQFKNRLNNKNVFLTKVMQQAKLWIKGDEDDIKKLGKPGKKKTA